MSYTYSIACKDCKVHLWIAQGRGYNEITKLHLYTAPNYTEALKEFLTKHYRHNLVFAENTDDTIIDDDFVEIEVEGDFDG